MAVAGIYTQSRELPTIGDPRQVYRLNNSSVIQNGTNQLINNVKPTQTTTSFRSGGDRLGTLIDSPLTQILQDPQFAKNGNKGMDTGHPFSTEKRLLVPSHPSVFLRSKVGSRSGWFRGAITPDSAGITRFTEPSVINTNFWGPKAIRDTIPTKPIANLSTTTAEILREGIPQAIGSILSLASRADFFRSLGKEYLNAEFGWAPLVRELNNIAKIVINYDAILHQYRRDSGLIVRRRYAYPPDVTYNTIATVSNAACNDVTWANAPDVNSKGANVFNSWAERLGTLVVTDRVYERYSFAGAYSYYLNIGSSAVDQSERFVQEANKLLGLRITPEVLWNLAPWSWLVDWVANIGTNLSNASALQSDGLVIRWGYLMRHFVSHRRFTLTGPVLSNGDRGPFSLTYIVQRKERVKATPFGFGLNPNDFSAGQWAILAALGMSKAPRILG
jgi:hypothetical protein